MAPLDPALRRVLEVRIIAARKAAEAAARSALDALAVREREPYANLGPEDRKLRNQLRARARQLGEGSLEAGYDRLVAECAYEQWHRMLFARFLAENDLLMHPEGVPVTLADCAELAGEEGDADAWATASRYAARMLPGIFRNEDPVLKVRLFPEGRSALERILEEIPPPAFTSDDGLGWVYQFWQTEAKREVNASGRKIGGADLPAVTQLFTEDYMVKFLLHNTLGAWWAARHPDSPINETLEYLRRLDDGAPAAGNFPGWPETVAELRVLDPCCGSGHVLTASADLLARMRAEEEGLDEAEAFEAVLRDNLFGLELDARCTQLAAFALALQAWKRGGYRELPIPNVACSGLAAGGRMEEWTRLANGDARLEETLRRLHALFKNAPDLGSLIDPSRVSQAFTFEVADFEEAEELLGKALTREKNDVDLTAAVFGETARGLARAAALLKGRYHLVATNVPYLARGKQDEILKDHLEKYYPAGKADLATAFVQRCSDYCAPGGSYALVTPQNWLFLGTYKKLRERLLKTQSWDFVVRLGPKGFQTPMWDFNVMLITLSNTPPASGYPMAGLDVSDRKTPAEKDHALHDAEVLTLPQAEQLENPDARVVLEESSTLPLLQKYARSFQGIKTGDDLRYRRTFWEVPSFKGVRPFHSTVASTQTHGGLEHVVDWRDHGAGMARLQGMGAWRKQGVAVSQMGNLPAALFFGDVFDSNMSPIIPNDKAYLPAIWSFCSSQEFSVEVRKIDQALKPTNTALVKVPFDLERWQKVADEQYPDGLPEPYSDDPTQWLFKGIVTDTTEPLQVAVARLLGYSWPDQAEDGLAPDADSIVCLPAVEDELPAAERLRSLLARAYGEEWSPALLDRLLAGADHAGKDLGTWLRDKFFAQHCKLFHNRPFIWHVWDGRKDGFSALVNYHRLDKSNLGRLIYTYLGDWIEAQTSAARAGVTGADLRLAAAQDLKRRLEAILHGEPPHDIYVRWKPLHEQPIGWEPDLNDGVRLNIRPFMQAGVLRARPNIKWNKDRGKNPDGSERHNDLHLTRAEKDEARRKQANTP
ncbi:N-6 DNA methylase [Rubrobacter marinus]|uniref:site-specific DNA-methyltransferase (adenine-specific) n=1 Tax=Rubrobacter marinus TaxID=2653852 RepID=A0A6G8PU86_9ACTN|nr:N-6 DNA methylase [Rubrobacter marinus]QIN77521.1 N-6 DNA methylase [Rubrobacter marinus]